LDAVDAGEDAISFGSVLIPIFIICILCICAAFCIFCQSLAMEEEMDGHEDHDDVEEVHSPKKEERKSTQVDDESPASSEPRTSQVGLLNNDTLITPQDKPESEPEQMQQANS